MKRVSKGNASVFSNNLVLFIEKIMNQTKYGVCSLVYMNKLKLITFFMSIFLVGIWAYKNTPYKHLAKLIYKYFEYDAHHIEVLISKIPFWYEFPFYVLIVILISLMGLGKHAFALERSVKKSFRTSKLSNGEKSYPKLESLKQISQDRYLAKVDSNGIDVDTFKSKSKSIRAMTGLEVENILENKKDLRKIELYFNRYPLTQMLKYSEVRDEASNPGDFVIGRGKSGLITQNITDYPHMLVAGSSGFGKSYFLKQMVLNQLENTQNLQVYVFDFKQGIAFKLFRDLPNVNVYTDIHESNEILGLLKEEMDQRFEMLKDGDDEAIDLNKHKKDPVLIVVDECSMLYTPSKIDSTQKEISLRATDITEKISKLSRAARFHLILGSQKITKDTVNTHIQENLEGRLCMKVSSFAGSSLVVGNKSAMDLPAINGRAMYKFGTVFEEVQTPYLDNKELKERVAVIAEEYRSGKRKLMQPMLDKNKLQVKATKKVNVIDDKIEESDED